MRQTFAYICCFCFLSNANELWETYKGDMALDYLRVFDDPIAFNKAPHDLEDVFKQHGTTCSIIGLPSSVGEPEIVLMYDANSEHQEANSNIETINLCQLNAFNKIMEAVDNPSLEERYFYLDGPGGSEKTHIYSTLLSFVRGKSLSALAFATIGIAATLLIGGRTVNSGFKLLIPLLDTYVSSMRLISSDAKSLKSAVILIIDE